MTTEAPTAPETTTNPPVVPTPPTPRKRKSASGSTGSTTPATPTTPDNQPGSGEEPEAPPKVSTRARKAGETAGAASGVLKSLDGGKVPALDTIASLPAPGGIALLLLLIVVLLLAIVPVNDGKTRLQLLWLAITNRLALPDNASTNGGGAGGPFDAAPSGGSGSGATGSGEPLVASRMANGESRVPEPTDYAAGVPDYMLLQPTGAPETDTLAALAPYGNAADYDAYIDIDSMDSGAFNYEN